MGEKNNNIIEKIEEAEVLSFGKRDRTVYARMISNIEKGFTKASEAYVLIACNLWQIHHDEYFRIDNYKSIADFALDVFEMKKATVHNYIKVIEKFGDIENGKAKGLQERYSAFKCSQLINMLTFTPEQLEQVQPDWSVRQIIAFGKEGLPDAESSTAADSSVSTDSSESDSENDNVSDYMTAPEINSGRTFLMEFDDLNDIDAHKEQLLNAFINMKNDKDFQNKNVRFVLELAFD